MPFILPPLVYFSNMLLYIDLNSKEISTNIACMPFIITSVVYFPNVYFSNMLPNKDLDYKELRTNLA